MGYVSTQLSLRRLYRRLWEGVGARKVDTEDADATSVFFGQVHGHSAGCNGQVTPPWRLGRTSVVATEDADATSGLFWKVHGHNAGYDGQVTRCANTSAHRVHVYSARRGVSSARPPTLWISRRWQGGLIYRSGHRLGTTRRVWRGRAKNVAKNLTYMDMYPVRWSYQGAAPPSSTESKITLKRTRAKGKNNNSVT
jgi:hypothetical protein